MSLLGRGAICIGYGKLIDIPISGNISAVDYRPDALVLPTAAAARRR